MNIFYLDSDPAQAAVYHCDKHVVKMIVEAAQMLSTAHRVLDGTETTIIRNGRKAKRWQIDAARDHMYQAAHVNHPSNIWTRECAENYSWHYSLFVALCDEYTHRYGKVHSTDALLRETLKWLPSSINRKIPGTVMPLAMNSAPECMDHSDPIKSYRQFYQTKQDRFRMVWTKRETPDWFSYKSTTTNAI